MSTELLDLIVALRSPEQRQVAARALARHLGADDLLLFIRDEEIGVLLPAPGLPQTLPGGAAWRAFLEACAAAGPTGVHRGTVLDPASAEQVAALGAQAIDGSVVVFLGGAPASVNAVRRLLPLVSAAVRGERAARAAAAQANLAREAAARAEALATSLDQSRRDLRDALQREVEAHAAAAAALRARDEFLSVAAHELKTPLTSLRGNAQLASRWLSRHGSLEPEQIQKLVETVEAQSTRLASLISQLLDVSRIRAGKLILDRRPTDLVAVLSSVAASAGHERHVSVHAPPHLIVDADPVRIEQVFANLIDNAIKYSPDGREVVARVDQPAPGLARVAVRDHGLGIPPDRRAHLFERFYQAHGEGHFGGMGLGLYISKQIVEQHGGTIEAQFPDDGGCRFVVTLPVHPQPAPESATS